jgi:glycosyltransferase involved in cell wall biosynthesis
MLKADIVVPCFNEEKVLGEFYSELEKVLLTLKFDWTIIFVNDGSTDNTKNVIGSFRTNKNIREIVHLNLSKNLGHMLALREGLKVSKGVFTISLDCDLQDPPIFISDLVNEYLSNPTDVDCIVGQRKDRRVDSFVKRQTAKIYYWLARKYISPNMVSHAADYRLITCNFRKQLLNYTGPYPIYRVLIPLSTDKLKVLNYSRNSRFSGSSKYSIKKMFQLAGLSFFYFSSLPLKILNYLVYFSVFFNMGIFFYILSAKYYNLTVPGWSSTVLVLSMSMLLLIIFVNIFGRYTYHNFLSSQGLPLFIISDKAEEVDIEKH